MGFLRQFGLSESELGILDFDLLIDGNIGIGVLPQIQESLVKTSAQRNSLEFFAFWAAI